MVRRIVFFVKYKLNLSIVVLGSCRGPGGEYPGFRRGGPGLIHGQTEICSE